MRWCGWYQRETTRIRHRRCRRQWQQQRHGQRGGGRHAGRRFCVRRVGRGESRNNSLWCAGLSPAPPGSRHRLAAVRCAHRADTGVQLDSITQSTSTRSQGALWTNRSGRPGCSVAPSPKARILPVTVILMLDAVVVWKGSASKLQTSMGIDAAARESPQVQQ